MNDSNSLLDDAEKPKVQKKVRFSNIVTVYREPSAHKYMENQNNTFDLEKFTKEPILVPFQHKNFTKQDDDATTCSCVSLGILIIFLFFFFLLIVVLIRHALLIEMDHQAPPQNSFYQTTK